MSAETVGSVILWLIFLAIVVVIAVYLLRWLYRRSTKETAFVRTGFGGHPLGLLNRAVNSIRFGCQPDLPAVRPDHPDSLVADPFGHDRNEPQVKLSADERHGDAGGSTRGLDYGVPGTQPLLAERLPEDVAGHPVFGGPARIEELQLAPDARSGVIQLNCRERRRSRLRRVQVHIASKCRLRSE